MHPLTKQVRPAAYFVFEAFVWGFFFAATVVVTVGTLNADFPARARSLGGEALVAALSAGLAFLSLRRVARPGSPSASPRLDLVLFGARLVLLLPVLAFLLVVAAAGFSA